MAGCDKCDGAGWVVLDLPGHPKHGKAVPCRCLIQERKQKAARRLMEASNISEAELRKWTFDSFRPGVAVPDWKQPEWCTKLCTPKTCDNKDCLARYRSMFPKARELMAKVKKVCREWAESPVGWLIIYGPLGSGKTHLAYAVASHQLETGRAVYVATAPELLDQLREGYNDERYDFDTRYKAMMEVDLLVIDDWGTQSSTAWAQEKLYALVNHRYAKDLPLAVTTNLDLADPRVDLSPRILSRFMEGTNIILRASAGDYRRFREGTQ